MAETKINFTFSTEQAETIDGESLTLESAVILLNQNKHGNRSDWVTKRPEHGEATAECDAGTYSRHCRTEFEAIAIAEKYLRRPETGDKK